MYVLCCLCLYYGADSKWMESEGFCPSSPPDSTPYPLPHTHTHTNACTQTHTHVGWEYGGKRGILLLTPPLLFLHSQWKLWAEALCPPSMDSISFTAVEWKRWRIAAHHLCTASSVLVKSWLVWLHSDFRSFQSSCVELSSAAESEETFGREEPDSRLSRIWWVSPSWSRSGKLK